MTPGSTIKGRTPRRRTAPALSSLERNSVEVLGGCSRSGTPLSAAAALVLEEAASKSGAESWDGDHRELEASWLVMMMS